MKERAIGPWQQTAGEICRLGPRAALISTIQRIVTLFLEYSIGYGRHMAGFWIRFGILVFTVVCCLQARGEPPAPRTASETLGAFVGEWDMDLFADPQTFGDRGGPGSGAFRPHSRGNYRRKQLDEVVSHLSVNSFGTTSPSQ